MLNGLCPDSFRGKFIIRSEISSYSTRNQLDIDIPRQIWNSQREVSYTPGPKHGMRFKKHQNFHTISMFKRNLKGFLQS